MHKNLMSSCQFINTSRSTKANFQCVTKFNTCSCIFHQSQQMPVTCEKTVNSVLGVSKVMQTLLI